MFRSRARRRFDMEIESVHWNRWGANRPPPPSANTRGNPHEYGSLHRGVWPSAGSGEHPGRSLGAGSEGGDHPATQREVESSSCLLNGSGFCAVHHVSIPQSISWSWVCETNSGFQSVDVPAIRAMNRRRRGCAGSAICPWLYPCNSMISVSGWPTTFIIRQR